MLALALLLLSSPPCSLGCCLLSDWTASISRELPPSTCHIGAAQRVRHQVFMLLYTTGPCNALDDTAVIFCVAAILDAAAIFGEHITCRWASRATSCVGQKREVPQRDRPSKNPRLDCAGNLLGTKLLSCTVQARGLTRSASFWQLLFTGPRTHNLIAQFGFGSGRSRERGITLADI